MPTHRVRSLVRSALIPPASGPDDRPDRELLGRFLASADEGAFAALVRRHGPVVLAVCRAALRDPADADDAFQATFLVLVRKAARIRDRAALGGWLYAVATRVARRLRAAARHPAPLPDDLPDRAGGEATACDLRAVLDEEVARLPEVYRLAVQVCYAAGRTTAEAAALLGWPRGTVLTRLAWARRRLRSRLAARGVGLAVGAFGTVLGRPAAFAVGRALLASTTRAAAAVAAGESVSEVVSERTVTLTEGVVRAMTTSKLKWAAGAVLVAVLAGAGIGRWADAGEPGAQPPGSARSVAPPDPAGRPAEPPRPADPPPVAEPPARDRTPERPSARPPATRPDPLPAPTVLNPPQPTQPDPQPSVPSQTAQAGGGRQFVVSRPVGTWSQEVVLQNGADEQPVRVAMKFDEDRLTVRMVAAVERQEVEIVLEADYSITRDSVVFGVVTGFDVRVPAGGRVPASVTLTEEECVDQPFTFRFRVDRGTLTVRDLRMPGVGRAGDVGLGQVLAGRFAAGAEDAPAAQPQPPGKGRGPSVVPRRVVPPAARSSVSSSDPLVLPPQASPVQPVGTLPAPQPAATPGQPIGVLPGPSPAGPPH